MAQALLHRMMAQRESDVPRVRANRRPPQRTAAEMRVQRALQRWRVLGDKLFNLTVFIEAFEAWLPDSSRRLLLPQCPPDRSASTPSSTAASSKGANEKQLEYAMIIKYAPKISTRKSATPATADPEVCLHPAVSLKGRGNQYSKDVYWPTVGRHFFRCQKRICEFFMWDLVEQAQLRAQAAPPETQEIADMELEMEQKVNVEIGRLQSQAEMYVQEEKEKLEAMFEDRSKKMKEGYQQEIAQLQQQMHQQAAWMQSFMAQANGGFEMAQLQTARQLQMRAFCPSGCATPWAMPVSRVYYVKNQVQPQWKKQVGWLPRCLGEDNSYLAIFEDEGGMIMWSEEFGKVKSLPDGKHKMLKASSEKLIQAWHAQEFGKVWEFVSPKYGLAESDNPVYEDHEVGLLWPMFPEMFWEMVRERCPEVMFLKPDKTAESLELASQAAEWQDARGKPFVLLMSADCVQDVSDLTRETRLNGRRELREFSGGAAVMSNSGELMPRIEPSMLTFIGVIDCIQQLMTEMHNESRWQVVVNGFPQNQKALQGDVRCFHQNQEALQGDVDGFPQNQEALQGDCHILMFDGSVRRVVPKECDGSVRRVVPSDVFVEAGPIGDGEPPDPGALGQQAENVDLKPTEEEARLLKKVHENLGHPSNRDLARTLRIAHAKPHLVRYAAKEFSCPTCAARPQPKAARPAVLPKSYQPGQVIGIDVIHLPALNRQESFPALNVVDWGSGYSMVERLKEMTADHVWRTFMRTWVRTFGAPEVLIADLGTEFRGEFADLASQCGTLVRHIGARSPWQNGKTERAGAHYKNVFERARDSCVVSSWQELKTLMYEVESARNRFGNRSGFSPMQRQLGWSLRLPGSLLSDDYLDPQLVVQSAGDEVRRMLQLRQAAQEAYIKSQSEVALSKAKNARHRVPQKFLPGETVKERKLKHAIAPEARAGRKPAWVGPGVVLAVDGPNLWISMRGELWKASAEQCRPATSEEQLAKEVVAGELEALREEFVRGQLKRPYKDISDGGLPDDDDDGGDGGGGPDPLPPSRRQPVEFEDASQKIPVPDGGEEELDYSPSEGGSGEAISNIEEEPEREVSAAPLDLLPPELDNATAESVQRNERLDGNGPGTPSYDAVRKLMKHQPSKPYYHEAKRTPEVSNDVMIRGSSLKHRHTFMFFDDGSIDVRVDNWSKQRKKPHATSQSWVGFTVFSNRVIDTDAFASKPRGQGEVFDHEIKPEDRPEWDESDLQEWQKVKSTGAIRVLSLDESRKVRAELAVAGKQDRILPSRMVRRFNPADQPGQPDGKKSRWCIRGDCDPDLLELDRHSPTINTTTFGAVLQITASMHFPACVGDLRNAFCQSGVLLRKGGKLYAAQPRHGIPGLHPEQIVEIVAGMYGLGDAPAHWRRTLKQEILKLGYRESTLDPTIYVLHRALYNGEKQCEWLKTAQAEPEPVREPKVLSGVIAVEVDDLFTCGDSFHDEQVSKLQRTFKFGKFEKLMESSTGVSFNGRRIKQNADYGLEIDMLKFVQERLSPVSLAKGRKSDPKALANDSEKGQLRAVIGSLKWCARGCRPDAAAAASLGAASFPAPTIQDVLDVNRAVELVKSKPELSIKIQPIPLDALCWGVVSDASYANAHSGGSQGAYGIIAYHQDLHEGKRVPCSLISWKSGRIQKVVNSTLAAETQSLSKGLGELCWVVSVFNELVDYNFELVKWEETLKRNRVVTIGSEEADELLQQSLCIVDAKALYDHLSRESIGPSQDKRTSLEIQVVRQNMNSIGAKVRWVPHTKMIVDGLTKKGACMDAMYELLNTGTYQIVAEAQSLQDRLDERVQRGYNRR
ncbi:RE1 [Symbiodinium sp. CCMP2592]|nr:RE1 [Symbiodinium sp. CCMP2592]